jgi:hypothetical protein
MHLDRRVGFAWSGHLKGCEDPASFCSTLLHGLGDAFSADRFGLKLYFELDEW